MSADRERIERSLALLQFLTFDLGLNLTAWQFSCHLGEPESSAAEMLEQMHGLGFVTPARGRTWRLTARGRRAGLLAAHRLAEAKEREVGPTGGRRTGSAVCGDRAVPTASSVPGPGTKGPMRLQCTAVRTPDGSPGGRRVSRSP